MEVLRIRRKLIEYRESIGFTQKTFAEFLGVTRTYINLIENGNCTGSIKFWDKLQNKLCISDCEVWQFMKEGVNDKKTA